MSKNEADHLAVQSSHFAVHYLSISVSQYLVSVKVRETDQSRIGMPRGRGSKSLKTRFNLNKLARFHGVQQPDTEFIQFSKRECLRGILPGTITMFVFPFI